MDAHTLNAWTRFALQKGGIGSCTALVDNPATDPEDLMFMTGEKIIVLRRLDTDDQSTSASGPSARRKSTPDSESFFLGYCEGVVGRFKGSHVQIHGKLKKPVLMRRSGQGQIRDSSTKLLSQQAAASLPANQVPAGIPVTAVDSDGEEQVGSERRSSSATGRKDEKLRYSRPTSTAASSAAKESDPVGSTTDTSQPSAADGSDSDDSETMLPWAKVASSDSSDGEGEDHRRTLQTTTFLAPGPGQSPQKPSPTESHHPSSFGHGSNITPSGSSHQAKSPSQSTLSSLTSTSDDDITRRDQTFSIYDVYGRDSVAFPNFNLVSKGIGGIGEGVNGLAITSSQPPTPLMPGGFKQSPNPNEPRPSSARRPNAAPDPRAPPNQGLGESRGLASYFRRGAPSPRSELAPPQAQPLGTHSAPSSPSLSQDPPRKGGAGSPIGFDPKRRPSGKLNGPPQMAQIRIPPRSSGGGPASPLGPQGPRALPPQSAGHPIVTPEIRDRKGGASPATSYFPQGMQAAPIPSQTSSERDKVSAGQIRLSNSPNPGPVPLNAGPSGAYQPPHPNGNALTPNVPTGPGRRSPNSPSPNAGVAPLPGLSRGSGPSPTGQLAIAGIESPAPSTTSTRSGPPGRLPPCDAKGFFLGSGIPCRPIPEDRDTLDKWQAILNENDLTAARKSRKVKKLVQAGIPNSIRGKVWLFLANGSVRRRQGLFEQLCRTSQEPKKGRKGKEAAYEAIEKDVARSFPDNRLFQDGQPGKPDLEAILKGYTHYNPIIGYTHGIGLLVGLFLLHMAPEDAFWLLCALLRDVHLEGYYSNEMKQLHIDGVMFGQLLQSLDGPLAAHLQKLGIEPMHYTPNWFLPLFCRVLPWPTLFRVMDMFFYEGPTWIMQVALAIMRIVREPLIRLNGPNAREEALRLLLSPPPAELTPENVLTCALSVKLRDGELRKLSRNASKLVRESNKGKSPLSSPIGPPGPGQGFEGIGVPAAPVAGAAMPARN